MKFDRLFLAMAIAALLLAGCASTNVPPQGQNQSGPATSPQTPGANTSGPAEPPANETPPTCDEYCRGLPHIQCVGTWNITGTYPGCVCGYECEVSEPQEQPDDEPLATPTNLSVSEMMQNGLEGQKSDFYLSNDGQYTEKTYTWLRQESGGGGFIIGGTAPATDVSFDGEPISSILASGFTVFENKAGGADKAYGLAIFNRTSTPLDGYTGSDTFDISYFPSMIDKDLKDCYVYTKDYNVDAQGGWLLTYYFRCGRATDK